MKLGTLIFTSAMLTIGVIGGTPVIAATVQINIKNFQFGSGNAPVTVQAGDTVKWTNQDAVTHTVTSGANRTADGKFDSAVPTGTSFSFTFTTAGTYPYFCRPHTSMVSSIVVTPAGPPSRLLGGASDNAVAAAQHDGTRLAAVAAGTRLYLVEANTSDLRDAANWAGGKALGAQVTGRPAFGGSAGQLLVAVGTDAGRAMLFDAVSGSTLGDVSVPGATLPEAAAIVPHGTAIDVYWSAQTASGPALLRTRGSQLVSTTSLGGPTANVQSSPAVYNGTLVVGTSAELRVFRVDPSTGVLTPQGSANVPKGDFNTSPVITARGEALIGSAAGKVYKVNLSTGAPDGAALQLPAASAPLSSPFYRAASDEAYFGGADGAIYRVHAGAIGDDAMGMGSIPFGTGRVGTPAVVGTNVFAVDSTGKFGVAGSSTSTSLGATPGRAVAVTGVTSGADVALMNTTAGMVYAVPLP